MARHAGTGEVTHRKFVDPKFFILAWQRAKTPNEAAEKVGISSNAAQSKAAMMRSKGVPLKRFARRKKFDWMDLAEYAKTLGRG